MRGAAVASKAAEPSRTAQAERARLVLGNEEAVAAVSGDPAQAGGVAALSVRGNFMFDPATHRDFLGALLGTGIERQKVLSPRPRAAGPCEISGSAHSTTWRRLRSACTPLADRTLCTLVLVHCSPGTLVGTVSHFRGMC